MPSLFQLRNVVSHQFAALLAFLAPSPRIARHAAGPVANDIDVSNACDWGGL
jgi:hypothetical protein